MNFKHCNKDPNVFLTISFYLLHTRSLQSYLISTFLHRHYLAHHETSITLCLFILLKSVGNFIVFGKTQILPGQIIFARQVFIWGSIQLVTMRTNNCIKRFLDTLVKRLDPGGNFMFKVSNKKWRLVRWMCWMVICHVLLLLILNVYMTVGKELSGIYFFSEMLAGQFKIRGVTLSFQTKQNIWPKKSL